MPHSRLIPAAGFLFSLLAMQPSSLVFAETCAPDTLLHSIPNPLPTLNDQFGISVAVSGNWIVVGAEEDDPGTIPVMDAGRAYVYNAATGAFQVVLNNPAPAAFDRFGAAIAVSVNWVVVGAAYDDPGSPPLQDVGTAYVFNATTGALQATLNNPFPEMNDLFGTSVAISGNVVVVGARGDAPGGLVSAGAAYVFDALTGNLLATLNNPTPEISDNFGASVSISGTLAVVGAPQDNPGGVGDAGTAYTFNALTGLLQAALNNPMPNEFDFFGGSVAISGNVAVVGAKGDDFGAGAAGTAYAFNATAGTLQATLNNPTPAVNDTFGESVAVSGNLAVVGAWQDNPGGFDNAGTAYVFNTATGALQATLDNPAPETADAFGWAVAISGSMAVVGAPIDGGAGIAPGSAYTFTCTESTCAPDTLLRTIPNPVPGMNDRMGVSVAASGNLSVAGAYLDDPGLPNSVDSGTAYVFNSVTGTLQATLNNPNNAGLAENDFFGYSVGISGNLAVVGAYGDDAAGLGNAGTAYVFDAMTGALQATLHNPAFAVTASDYFGYSVAISGNLAVVGAYQDDPGGVSAAGTAYVFNATTGALLATLNNPAPAVNDYFGYSVAISGNRVLAGAYADNPGAVGNAGTAYIFNATTGALLATLNNPAPAVDDYFGWSVAIAGNRAVVGANNDDPGAVTSAGTAYTFDATTGALLATLNNPAPTVYDYFGHSVAISGGTAVVGAYADDPLGVNVAGTAYAFDVVTGAPLTILNNPALAAGDQFGYSVAISGDIATVGAYQDSPGLVTGAGSAYTFNCASPCAPDMPLQTLSNPAPAVYDYFGASVAIHGTTAVVGASQDSPGVDTSGTVYVFNSISGALQGILNNPAPEANDNFGNSVGVFGNLAVVGAFSDDPGGIFMSGSAYVFNTVTSGLVATLNNPTPWAADTFGRSVAISGNLVVVGADWNDPGGAGTVDAGTAYVFNATTGALVTTLYNPSAALSEEFGRAVAISGNLAVVGAHWDSPGGVNAAGSVYFFNATSGALLTTLENPAPEAGDSFGASVAVHGNKVIVGADWDSPGAVGGVGSAYIFDATTTALLVTLNNPDPTENDFFGRSVAIHGNIAVVGAAQNDPGGTTDAGAGYVFDVTTGILQATLNNPAPEANDFFGNSVAIHGNTALVGAQYDNPGIAGRAYTFACTPSIPLNASTLGGNTFPAQMGTGQGAWYGVTFRNTGNTTWDAPSGYALALTADSCGMSASSRFTLNPGEQIAPGQNRQFVIYLQAPGAPNLCNLKFRMTQEFVEFFGATFDVNINVIIPPNAVLDWVAYE